MSDANGQLIKGRGNNSTLIWVESVEHVASNKPKGYVTTT
jgi:hypothetical protein